MTGDPFTKRDTIDAYAVAVMVTLTMFWGCNQVAIKVAILGYSPVFLAIARSSIAAFLIWLWCLWRGIPLFDRDQTLLPGILAGLLFGLEFLLIFFGMDLTTAARGVLMVNTMPFWILIGAHFFLGERMTMVKLAGLILAFAGVALVFSDRLSMPDPSAIVGDAMILVAALFWASTTLVIKRSTLATARPEKTLLYQLVVSALIAFPALPFGAPHIRDLAFLPTAALLFQAVIVVAITYLIWFRMIRIYPAAGLSSFTFLTPAFGVLGGGLLLDEPLSIRIFLALALIAAGLLIVNRNPVAKVRSSP